MVGAQGEGGAERFPLRLPWGPWIVRHQVDRTRPETDPRARRGGPPAERLAGSARLLCYGVGLDHPYWGMVAAWPPSAGPTTRAGSCAGRTASSGRWPGSRSRARSLRPTFAPSPRSPRGASDLAPQQMPRSGVRLQVPIDPPAATVT